MCIRPGRSAGVDISPGTSGRALLDEGVLVLTSECKKREREQAQNPPDPRPEKAKAGQYPCPWCKAVSEGAEEGQAHVLTEHSREIMSYYGEVFHAFSHAQS